MGIEVADKFFASKDTDVSKYSFHYICSVFDDAKEKFDSLQFNSTKCWHSVGPRRDSISTSRTWKSQIFISEISEQLLFRRENKLNISIVLTICLVKSAFIFGNNAKCSTIGNFLFDSYQCNFSLWTCWRQRKLLCTRICVKDYAICQMKTHRQIQLISELISLENQNTAATLKQFPNGWTVCSSGGIQIDDNDKSWIINYSSWAQEAHRIFVQTYSAL